jgi:hypothetical protein
VNVPSYRIECADIEKDRQAILAVWKRNLPSTDKLEEKFDWHFLNNPSGTGRCWKLEADGELVGVTSLGMRHVKIGSSVLTGGVSCDLAVDKKHRFLQPALMLNKAVLASTDPHVSIVYGFPGSPAAAVMKRAGYGELCFVDRYAKVLRVSPHLRRLTGFSRLGPVMGGFIDFGYAALSSFSEGSRGDYASEVLTDFDGRFDELWDRVKDERAVLTVRDSKFMRWRYQECPLKEYVTIGLLSKDRSTLQGYLVCYVDGEYATCVDAFAAAEAHVFRCLILAWIDWARQRSLTSLSIKCSADRVLLDALKSSRFSRRTVPGSSVTSDQNDSELSGALIAHWAPAAPIDANIAAQWYFTGGDQPYN